jgi:hypothetical protein
MLPFAYPVIVVLLLPVIAIEAIYIKIRLRTSWKSTIAATAKANAFTLILGFPVTWLIFLLLEMIVYSALFFSGIEDKIHWTLNPHLSDLVIVVTSAAWMGPVEEKWALPVAFVVLLIPSFVVSGYFEARALAGEGKGRLQYGSKCAGVVWQANILSYIFLAAVGGAALAAYAAQF